MRTQGGPSRFPGTRTRYRAPSPRMLTPSTPKRSARRRRRRGAGRGKVLYMAPRWAGRDRWELSLYTAIGSNCFIMQIATVCREIAAVPRQRERRRGRVINPPRGVVRLSSLFLSLSSCRRDSRRDLGVAEGREERAVVSPLLRLFHRRASMRLDVVTDGGADPALLSCVRPESVFR